MFEPLHPNSAASTTDLSNEKSTSDLSISVVVVVFNMQREAMRTLWSLTVPYQRGIDAESFEVIVVENGSTSPLDKSSVESLGPNFRYYYQSYNSSSPAQAVNFGRSQARGRYVGLIIDGARIASPGLLSFAQRALCSGSKPVVATLAWHLGPDLQWASIPGGYDQQVEDQLLEESGWFEDGYNLFSISTLADSSVNGYFRTPAESSALFLETTVFDALAGFDESFTSSGGGYIAGDFFRRACEYPGTELYILLGEGTFHQIHGGASTNSTGAARAAQLKVYGEEYLAIRGKSFAAPNRNAIYLGSLPSQGHLDLVHSANRASYPCARVRSTKAPIPILFCIDSENDDFDPDPKAASRWATVEECFDRLGRYRQRLAQSTGRDAAFTWVVRADAQLREIYGEAGWGLRAYASQWRQLLAEGDDVGVHPHPQQWSAERGGWVGGQSDAVWTVKLAKEAHRAYTEILGREPQTFRFGNRYMGQLLCAAIEELGFKYDLTLEPGYPGRSGVPPAHRVPGFCPSYFGVPRAPYRPSVDDFRRPDPSRTSGLWFVPLSTVPSTKSMPRARGPHYTAFAPKLFPYETLMLRLAPDFFRRAIDHILHEMDEPYLAVVIRSDMIRLPEVWANLETLRTHPMATRFVFSKASTLVDLLVRDSS